MNREILDRVNLEGCLDYKVCIHRIIQRENRALKLIDKFQYRYLSNLKLESFTRFFCSIEIK